MPDGWEEAWRKLHDEYFRRRDALGQWLMIERDKLRTLYKKHEEGAETPPLPNSSEDTSPTSHPLPLESASDSDPDSPV